MKPGVALYRNILTVMSDDYSLKKRLTLVQRRGGTEQEAQGDRGHGRKSCGGQN